MLTNATLTAFSATSKPAESLAFYRDVLDLGLIADTPFAIVLDANGTSLRIQKVETVMAPAYTVIGWEVADIQASVDGLLERGVAFERYEGLPQDERGIWSTPDGAMVAWFKDPDGNTLSLSQSPA